MKHTEGLKLISFQRRYSMIGFGIFLMVAGFYYFILPINLVIGGVSGVGLLFSHFFDISIALIVLVLNVLLLLMAWGFLGFKSFYRSIYGSILFPLFLFLLEQFSPVIIMPDDLLIMTIFGGFIIGFGFGYVVKYGGTSGGTDIPIRILNKRLKMPLSLSIYVIDGLIIISGVIVFYQIHGIAYGLYALVAMVAAGKAADLVVVGTNTLKAVHIITDNPEPIKQAIFASIDRGVSMVKIQGGYSRLDKVMLLSVITRNEYYAVRNIVAELDPHAFVFASPATEIQGDFENRMEDD